MILYIYLRKIKLGPIQNPINHFSYIEFYLKSNPNHIFSSKKIEAGNGIFDETYLFEVKNLNTDCLIVTIYRKNQNPQTQIFPLTDFFFF